MAGATFATSVTSFLVELESQQVFSAKLSSSDVFYRALEIDS